MRYAGGMRYACEAIDSIWSEQSKLDRWLQVWRAQLSAVGHPHPLFGIKDFSTLVTEREKVTGHDVAAALDVLRPSMLDVKAAEWLHYGLCSSDVADAGYLLAIAEAEEHLLSLSRDVMNALQELSKRSKDVQTLYRTHGQAAQVSNGDARWNGYEIELDVVSTRLTAVRPSTFGLQGPTGTGSALTQEQANEMAKALGLRFRSLSARGQQAADRTQWALWAHAVAALATLSQRVATQIRLLAYEEVGEVTEGREQGYVGSSSMPHKSADGRSNPTRSERVCGMAAVIRGLANSYAEACSSVWDSHSLEHSCADRILLPQITGYTGFVLVELADVLRTLKINEGEIDTNRYGVTERWPDGQDSYRRRNRLIREGADGDTWKAAQS